MLRRWGWEWRKGTRTLTLVFEDDLLLTVFLVAVLFIFTVVGCRTRTQVHITIEHQNEGCVPREECGLFDGGRYGATACSMRALNGERDRID
jgi:hypothetical protein